MTQTEALKLALEFLEALGDNHWNDRKQAITAIKEALAQDSNRPVESNYISLTAYTRALEEYCEALAQPIQQEPAQKETYQQSNPLGGPAKVFDAMADAIRAGDSYESVLKQFGYQLAQPEQEYDWKDLYEKEKCSSAMWIAKYEEVAGPAPKAYPLAQPEQKPVAWANPNDLQNFDMKVRTNGGPLHTVPLYTTPPQPKEPAIIGTYLEKDKEQEPVAVADGTFNHNCPLGTPLYTIPPQRTWVGLNDEQMRKICGSVATMRDAVREAEAILKEGNT